MASKIMTPLVVDLSHHNEIDDWSKVYSSGIRGVIHKATQGSGMVDTTYAARKKAALKAGILWGAYHFGDNSDVQKQVDNYLATVKPDGKTLLCLDYEPNGSRTMSLAQAKQWLQLVFEKTGQKPVLYSGNLIKEQMTTPDPFLTSHRLWLAQYGPSPKVPKGWSSYWLWQFAGDGFNGAGIIPGIKTKGVDCNVFGGTDLAAEWVGAPASSVVATTSPQAHVTAPAPVAPAPAPTPDPTPSPLPGPVVPTPGTASVKDLRPFSRKLILIQWFRRAASFFGLSTAGDLTLQQAVDQSQGVSHVLETLIANPVLLSVVCVSVAVVVVCGILELYHVDDFNTGNWTPSGAR